MLSPGNLSGFYSERQAVTVETVTAPDNAYLFESADPYSDSVGSDDFTATGTGFSSLAGKQGDCLNVVDNSSYLTAPGVVTGSFAFACWFRLETPYTSTETYNLLGFHNADKFFKLTHRKDFIDIEWDDGVDSDTYSSTAIFSTWNFIAVSVASGASVKFTVNGSQLFTHSATPPDFTGVAWDVYSNRSSTINGSYNGEGRIDELYLWDSDALNHAKMNTLYNGGFGTFHPW